MCCFTTIALVLASRIAILVWWLLDQQRFSLAFSGWSLPGLAIPVWLWSLLGALFLPWTTLAYLFVVPGGVQGYEWLILLVGLVIDLAGHGGSYRHRHHIRRLNWRRGIQRMLS
jgi:hypothetical protein